MKRKAGDEPRANKQPRISIKYSDFYDIIIIRVKKQISIIMNLNIFRQINIR